MPVLVAIATLNDRYLRGYLAVKVWDDVAMILLICGLVHFFELMGN